MQPVELHTERLLLSAPTAADEPRIVEYCRDPAIAHFTTVPDPYQPRDATFFIERIVQRGWKTGTEFTFALRARLGDDAGTGAHPGAPSDGESVALNAGGNDASAPLLGVIGARVQPEPGVFDVGYWLGAPHRGRGYMPEAVCAVAAWLFEVPDARSVLWECFPGNVASAHTALKAGFAFTGMAPVRIPMRDGSRPDSWHGVLHRDAELQAEASTMPWPAEVLAR